MILYVTQIDSTYQKRIDRCLVTECHHRAGTEAIMHLDSSSPLAVPKIFPWTRGVLEISRFGISQSKYFNFKMQVIHWSRIVRQLSELYL